jgi:O-antigen ligase
MNTDTSVDRIQEDQASRAFLVVAAVGLFVVFFQVDHNIFFTVEALDRGAEQRAVSGISEGNIINRLALIFLAGFSFLIYIARKQRTRVLVGLLGLLLVFQLAWVVFSWTWAENSGLVARRIIAFVLLFWSAYAVSTRVRLRQLPTIVAIVTSLFLVIGVLTERMLGTWWFGSEGYRFSGTCHAEAQGVNCAMLLLAIIALSRNDIRPPKIVLVSGGIIATFFLILTRSRAPFVAVVLAAVVFQLSSAKARKRVLIILYAIVGFACVALLVLGGVFFEFLGVGILLGRREEMLLDFNGRWDLWLDCLGFAQQHPFGGFGFGGFWSEDRARAISESYGWLIESSHSIYLETVLNLGVVGLVLLVWSLILGWRIARRSCLLGREVESGFALSLLTLWMADGLLSTLLVARGFCTFLLLVVLMGLAMENDRLRHGD